jgi:hypothetical protein
VSDNDQKYIMGTHSNYHLERDLFLQMGLEGSVFQKIRQLRPDLRKSIRHPISFTPIAASPLIKEFRQHRVVTGHGAARLYPMGKKVTP